MATIFSDDAETADADCVPPWSGTSKSTGATMVGNDTSQKRGSYNIKSYTPSGTASGSSCVAYYGSLSGAYTHLYVGAWIKFDVLPEDSSDYLPFLGFWNGSTSNNCARAGVFESGGNYRWGFRNIYTGTSFHNVLGSSKTPSVNTYYWVVFEISIGNGDGFCKLYVDGDLEVSETSIDNDSRAVNYLRIGQDSGIPPDKSDLNIRFDDVILADAYPSPPGATYTKTFTLNVELQKNLTKTFTLNTELLKSLTETFTLGTELQQVFTEQFTLNTELVKQATKTFTLNAELLGNLTKQFTLNADLLQTLTESFSLNAELNLNTTTSFTLNTELSKSLLKLFSLNAELESGFIAGDSSIYYYDGRQRLIEAKKRERQLLIRKIKMLLEAIANNDNS